MFNRKKQVRQNAVIVTTKKELKAAIKRKEENIIVQGDLAEKLRWIEKLTPAKIAALTTLLGAAAIATPMMPISAVVSIPAVASITGTEIATVIFASGLSVAVILGILKGYTIIYKDGELQIIKK